ncbi:hypothetical protein [Methanobrevibacter sp.]|uniref:hypothetical protein n=1 Tax=Methanobrevibacter sp. TaxID=66852 RepID=UPI00388F704B
MADPNDKGNIDRIMDGIERQLSEDMYNQVNVYFLRGGIDYSILNLKHKTMMAFAYKRSKRLKEKERTAEIKAIIETYGKKVDFIDFDKLNPIINEIK